VRIVKAAAAAGGWAVGVALTTILMNLVGFN